MGRIRGLFAPRAQIGAERWDEPGLWTPSGGVQRATTAGEQVSPARALTWPTYLACLKNIAEDIGAQPWQTFRRVPGGGVERADDDARYGMLHDEWNEEMTSQVGRELMIQWAMGWGLGIAEKQYDGAGRTIALWPIHPSRVYAKRVNGGELVYMVRNVGTSDIPLRPVDVFAIHGVGSDGVCGYSLAEYMAETIGLGLATQTYRSAFFGNNAAIGVVFTTDETMTDEAYNRMKASIKEVRQGASKAFEPFVAEGAKVEHLGVNPKDADVVDQAKFTVEDFARVARIPLHMIGHLEHATFSNIEHQGIEYTKFTLKPWCVRLETESRRKVFPGEREYFTEIRLQALERGDYTSRTNAYRTLISTAVMTPNEARGLENENPSNEPGADSLWMQGAMAPIARLAKEPAAEPPAAAPPAAPPPVEPEQDDVAQPDPAQPDPVDDGAAKVEASRPLFVDAAARVARKEVMAATRAAARHHGDAAAFQRWARGFYQEQREDIVGAFGPLLETLEAEPASWLMEEAADAAQVFGRATLLAFADGKDRPVDEAARVAVLAERIMDRARKALASVVR